MIQYRLGYASSTIRRISNNRELKQSELKIVWLKRKQHKAAVEILTSPDKVLELARVGNVTTNALTPTFERVLATVKKQEQALKTNHKNIIALLPAMRAEIQNYLSAPVITSTEFIGAMKEVGEYVPGSIRHIRHSDSMTCNMKSIHFSDSIWMQDVQVQINTRLLTLTVRAQDKSIHSLSAKLMPGIVAGFNKLGDLKQNIVDAVKTSMARGAAQVVGRTHTHESAINQQSVSFRYPGCNKYPEGLYRLGLTMQTNKLSPDQLMWAPCTEPLIAFFPPNHTVTPKNTPQIKEQIREVFAKYPTPATKFILSQLDRYVAPEKNQ
jgi:hypothetical protein